MVVWEVVSNVVCYVKVSMLIVWVKVDDDLCIEVIDNGCGLFDEFIGSGLMNLW